MDETNQEGDSHRMPLATVGELRMWGLNLPGVDLDSTEEHHTVTLPWSAALDVARGILAQWGLDAQECDRALGIKDGSDPLTGTSNSESSMSTGSTWHSPCFTATRTTHRNIGWPTKTRNSGGEVRARKLSPPVPLACEDSLSPCCFRVNSLRPDLLRISLYSLPPTFDRRSSNPIHDVFNNIHQFTFAFLVLRILQPGLHVFRIDKLNNSLK